MDFNISVSIDTNLCVGCGICVEVCPHDTISVIDGKAKITGDHSISCGHCAAACPENAIKVDVIDKTMSCYNSFEIDDKWMGFGKTDLNELVRLMRSRRSCRNYKDKQISIDILDDLVKIGITAPSGSNCQLWTFHILKDRKSVLMLGGHVLNFFKRLNWMAEKTILRIFSYWFSNDELNKYYDNYYNKVKDAIYQFENNNIDKLFHGATAVILIGGKKGGSSPLEDALLASQNILLAAHAMGLGSCLIGFAVEAMKRDPSIKQKIGIPPDESIYSVIALGYPKEKYKRIAGRKKVKINILNS